MSGDRVIAQVRSQDGYAGLMDALRARVAEMDTTYESVDELAGLSTRYTGKLFARVPIKAIGRHSLGPLLGALGLKLIVVEDTVAMAQIKGRVVKREVAPVTHTHAGMRAKRRRRKSTLMGCSAWGRMMVARRYLKQSPEQRSASARKAARARWGRRRRPRQSSS